MHSNPYHQPTKKPHFSLPKALVLLTIIAVLSAIGVYVYTSWNGSNSQGSQSSASSSSSSVKPKVAPPMPDTVSLNTLFMGDVFWARYVDDWAKKSDLKLAYPFSGLHTFEREKYDAWIADMECPITSTYINSATQDNTLKFSCPAEYTPEAAKWFSAFTLANNHMDNMEEVQGLQQTRDNLEKNGIQYFGHFDNGVKQDICEVVSFKARINFTDPTKKTEYESFKVQPEAEQLKELTAPVQQDFYIPLALCGFHNVFKLPTPDQIEVITEYAKYLPTIIMPHQGAEYQAVADQLQRSYARQYIDHGADAVIGDHVHVVQDSEEYKGKLIIYSTGNFIFDQQASPSVRQGIAVNLAFDFPNTPNLQQWLKFSQTCVKFKDDCLAQAKAQNLTKPKFSLKYDAIGTDNSNKLAKRADGATQQQILQRVKWSSTLPKLQTEF
jgi:hypothetical protein